DRGASDRGMLGQAGLDLAGGDGLAPGLDHFLEPSLDPAVAALVHRRAIACPQPAVGVDRLARFAGPTVIAGGDPRAANAQLAGPPAPRDLAGAGIDHLDVRVRKRPAGRALPIRGGIDWTRYPRRSARLGHAVDAQQPGPEFRRDAAHERRLERRAAGHDRLE